MYSCPKVIFALLNDLVTTAGPAGLVHKLTSAKPGPILGTRLVNCFTAINLKHISVSVLDPLANINT